MSYKNKNHLFSKDKLNQIQFLKSALSYNNPFTNISKTIEWINIQNEKVNVRINPIDFKDLKLWRFTDNQSRIVHESGKFFSIDGIQVKTNWGSVNSWNQPIINQAEIGYLGFICKEFNGILHFLMQAKIEPGNVNYVQLSPTLQATKSNYSRTHKGKAPDYLDYFIHVKKENILLDQLQSEQGARFLKKRNRNIIIKVDEDIEVKENFIWLTLAEIKDLMSYDNLVNMDTRTVISGISYGEYHEDILELLLFHDIEYQRSDLTKKFLHSYILNRGSINGINDIISTITKLKSYYELEIERISLTQCDQWEIKHNCIEHKERKYFRVIAVDVEIGNREVVQWTQPMIEPAQEGLCAFICKEINGVLHLLVQCKLECGNFDIIELAPTVQCLTGNYNNEHSKNKLPYLDYVLNAKEEQILFSALQSEEGGRFFKEQNRNRLILADSNFPLETPDHFIWMTLHQCQLFIKFNNYFNIQSRSLLSAIKFVNV